MCSYVFILFSVKLFIEERYNPNMSLNDIEKDDDEYEDIRPKRKKGRGIGKKIFGKTKIFILILIIGIIMGTMLGHYYIEPMLSEMEGSTCKSCMASKELLTKEHDCLYSIINDPTLINSCQPTDTNS